MPRPVVFNNQRTADLQTKAAALHPQVVNQLTPVVVTNIDQSAQIAEMLARGMLNADDVRAYKGV